MRKVYTLADLAAVTHLKSTGFKVNVRPGVYVTLFGDVFNVYYEDKRTEHFGPGQIIKKVEELKLSASMLTDSQLFELVQEQNSEADEEEYFELDLENNPKQVLNAWLKKTGIALHVKSVYKLAEGDYLFEVN